MNSDTGTTSAVTPPSGPRRGERLRVLALADLAAGRTEATRRIEAGTVQAALAALAPTVQLRVANRLGVGAPELACTLSFRSFDDFAPERLARAHPLTAGLYRLREVLAPAVGGQVGPGSLSERLREACGDGELAALVNTRPAPAASSPAVGALFEMVDLPTAAPAPTAPLGEVLAAAVSAGGGPAVERALAAVDYRLTLQLASIADAPPLRDLEAAWRGLELLLARVPSGGRVLVEVQPVPRADALDAFYDEHFEREHAGETDPPLGLVVVAFPFDRSPRDSEDLQVLARMGASLGVPFLGEVGPEFFGVKQLGLVATMPDLGRKSRGPEYAKYNRLRSDESSLWLALACNRPLLRPAWGEPGAEVRGLGWDAAAAAGANRPLYASGAWALAAAVAQGFQAEGLRFPVAGSEGPALLAGLPTHSVKVGKAESVALPVEVPLSEQKALELVESGFAPLVGVAGSDRAYFLSAPSVHAVTRYDSEEATAASFRAATLPYQLFASVAARELEAAARSCPPRVDADGVKAHVRAELLQFLASAEESPQAEEVEVEVTPAANALHQWDISVRLRPAFTVYGGTVDLVLGTQAMR